jgi:toluene monooxygenase system protein E
LKCDDWDGFSDPRELTYAAYTAQRTVSEQFVDKIFSLIEEDGLDQSISADWLAVLSSVLAPMRFPYHVFQMVASYVGQMAPSSKIAICCALQAADEMRTIQRIAYRMGQLRIHHPEFANGCRKIWEHDPVWQDVRKLLESLLVTYDWAEAAVTLNTMVKPELEQVFLVDFPRHALARGDHHLKEIFSSLHEDSAWHFEWGEALVVHALKADPHNAEVIGEWNAKWQPLVDNATEQFRDHLSAVSR